MKIKRANYKGIALLLAAVTTFAIEGLLKVDSQQYVVNNSIFAVFILGAAYVFFKNYVLIQEEKRLYVVSGVLGFFYSFCLVCGRNMLLCDTTGLDTLETWGFILGGIPLLGGLVMVVLLQMEKAKDLGRIESLDKWFSKNLSPKKTFWLSWILIFIGWLPGLIATYPGIYGYDSVFQLGFYIDGEIDLWHPLAHTYLMGFCIEELGALFGSREAGLFCYSILQMLFLSGVYALLCSYMARKKMNASIRMLAFMIIVWIPIHTIMSISCTKDIPFAGLLGLMTYMLLQIAEDEKYLSQKRKWVYFLLTTFGLLIFRNQGIYVMVLVLVCGLFLARKQWKRMLVLLVTTVVMFGVYSGPVTDALNGVEPSKGIEEMLSVPIMQVCRTVGYEGDLLTEEEIRLAEEYIPMIHDYMTRGDRGIADHFKEDFDSVRFKENPMEFIKLWAKLGIKSPISYVDAFARLSIGLWYPDMNYPDMEAYHPYWEYDNTIQKQEEWILLERTTPESFKWLAEWYHELAYENTYQKYPVISMLFSGGFFVWLLFLFVAWCIYKKEYQLLLPASLLVLYWLTTLLGPVVLYRYLYPIVISVPVLLCRMATGRETQS